MPPFFQSAIAKPPQRQLSHDLLLQPNQPAKGSQAALLNASPLRCVNVVGLDPRVHRPSPGNDDHAGSGGVEMTLV
jgi:hypothetical protein